jgi:hypothetical protein
MSNTERCTATSEGFAEYIAELNSKNDFVLIAEEKKVYAHAIGITDEEFEERLKECKSEYMYDTVGYSDGKAITRFNLIYLFKKTILKMIKRIECDNRETLTYDEKRFFMDQLELKLDASIRV